MIQPPTIHSGLPKCTLECQPNPPSHRMPQLRTFALTLTRLRGIIVTTTSLPVQPDAPAALLSSSSYAHVSTHYLRCRTHLRNLCAHDLTPSLILVWPPLGHSLLCLQLQSRTHILAFPRLFYLSIVPFTTLSVSP